MEYKSNTFFNAKCSTNIKMTNHLQKFYSQLSVLNGYKGRPRRFVTLPGL